MNQQKNKKFKKVRDSIKRYPAVFEAGAAVVAGIAVASIIVFGLNLHQHTHDNHAYIGGSTNGHTHNVATNGSTISSLFKVSNNKNSMDSLIKPVENECLPKIGELSESDLNVARIAWQYFENNYNPETGLVNAVNNFPSTTLWDSGSALAATIAAVDFGFISQKEFDDRISAMMGGLARMQLFNGEAPNKVYNTQTLDMVDYGNNKSDFGIGVSTLDLARFMSWAKTLSCMHPKYHVGVEQTLSRWNFDRLIKNDQMYGLASGADNPQDINVWQEGRLGYEQYAGKIFRKFGFDVDVSASYENEFRGNIEILGVNIAHDNRDPREFHANNYVLTESYTMDAMELGLDDENRKLVRNIYDVQKKRWKETGIVTAISEDNINEEPWFLYNSIYNAGKTWQTTNSSDVEYDHLKTVSTKAAISMALMYPDDEYSAVLMNTIESAYDIDQGWYSGIYENGKGYNTVTTANTNGVILSGLLYKKYGPTLKTCKDCAREIKLTSVDFNNK